MKKLTITTSLLVAMLIIAAGVFAGGKGAQRHDLIEIWPPTGEDVGGTNINISADNKIIATSQINRGLPGLVLSMYLWRWVPGFGWQLLYEGVDAIVLDEEGSGSGQIKVPVPPELLGSNELLLGVDVTDWMNVYYLADPEAVPVQLKK